MVRLVLLLSVVLLPVSVVSVARVVLDIRDIGMRIAVECIGAV